MLLCNCLDQTGNDNQLNKQITWILCLNWDKEVIVKSRRVKGERTREKGKAGQRSSPKHQARAWQVFGGKHGSPVKHQARQLSGWKLGRDKGVVGAESEPQHE